MDQDINKKNYIYIIRNGSMESFKDISDISYLKNLLGTEEYKFLPLTSSIQYQYYSDDSGTEPYLRDHKRLRIHSLKNTLQRNKIKSEHYSFSSSLGDKLTQELTLISIPSIFYGSSIKKGSVDLSINYRDEKIARIQDIKYNGELIETLGSNTGSVAGVILYEEGFIILTGSWDQNIESTEIKWSLFGTGSDELFNSGSFDIDFNGTNDIQTITMLAHAEKSEMNHSNNPTYVKFGQNLEPIVSQKGFYEPDNIQIKNITKYNYDNFTGSLEKQTYISKIAIYDEEKNLIGIAKLAKPVRKSTNRDFTFKLKLDF